ncbi:MAG TPA: hypothetical protein VIY48_22165 [Candidatus Paceibacterota bacterium]
MPYPGLELSALDFIKSSLRALNVIQSGEDPSAEEGNDCLQILNQMLDAWNSDGLTIFTIQINDFPLVSTQQTYTLGSGGDFDMPRPAFIDRASVLITTNAPQPIEYVIPIYTTQDWQQKVPVKNVLGNLPLLVYDDGAYPFRNLTYWPAISDSNKARLYTWQSLTQFSNLTDLASYPPGYAEALISNLALRIAAVGGFQSNPSDDLRALAAKSLANVKMGNADDTQLRSDLNASALHSGAQMRAEIFNIPTL